MLATKKHQDCEYAATEDSTIYYIECTTAADTEMIMMCYQLNVVF